MSDNIDYDELDRAVNAAMSARKTAKEKPKATPAAPVSRVQKVSRPAPKPAQRGMFMDFAPVKISHSAPAQRTRAAAPVRRAPARPVAKPIARPAARPVARPVAKPAAKPIARPAARPVARPAAKPVARPVAKPAARPAPINRLAARPAVKPTYKATAQATAAMPTRIAATRPAAHPTPAKAPAKAPAEPQPILKPKTKAPNANNYSLGGKSPFITPQTKVEKRPLGAHVPETSTRGLRSTHNVYSQKSPTRSNENTKKHVVTESTDKKSGWLWTLIVIGIIAAGGGLGYLAYLLVFAH